MIQSYSKKSICKILRYLWHSNLQNRKSSGKSSKFQSFMPIKKTATTKPIAKKDFCSSCQSKLHIANPSIPNFPGNSDGPSTKSTSPLLVTSAELQAMKNRCGNLKPSWNLIQKAENLCQRLDAHSSSWYKKPSCLCFTWNRSEDLPRSEALRCSCCYPMPGPLLRCGEFHRFLN